MTVSAI